MKSINITMMPIKILMMMIKVREVIKEKTLKIIKIKK
jgi:hypothetical protein